jgi:orotate phosphoribosyltransferase
MPLRRGFEEHAEQRVLITEDVVTTGKSSFETIEALKQYGVEIVGIACIANRSKEDVGYPIFDAIRLDIESWEPENCPLCKQGIPFVKPGSRTR